MYPRAKLRRLLDFSIESMPQTSLQLVRPPLPDTLYHYTSLDAASAIIANHSLRLTRHSYLNDKTELKHATARIQEALNVHCRTANGRVLKLLESIIPAIARFSRENICVASFCENGDLLSQWRAYGNRGQGVALGFSTKTLDGVGRANKQAALLKCIYDDTEKQRVVDDAITRCIGFLSRSEEVTPCEDWDLLVEALRPFCLANLLQTSAILKDSAFSEEAEWRIVTDSIALDDNYHAQVSNGRITTFLVHEFEKHANGHYEFLSEIRMGPREEDDFNRLAHALEVLTHQHKVSEFHPDRFVRISRSSIPLRSTLS